MASDVEKTERSVASSSLRQKVMSWADIFSDFVLHGDYIPVFGYGGCGCPTTRMVCKRHQARQRGRIHVPVEEEAIH
jgi:hypothetical protein